MKSRIVIFLAGCFATLGAFAQSQNTLLPIGNVGIKTLRPQYPLDVHGESRFLAPVNVDSVLNVRDIISTGSTKLKNLLVDTIGTTEYILGVVNGEVQALSLPGVNQLLGSSEAISPDCFSSSLGAVGTADLQFRVNPFWTGEAEGMNAWLFTGANCKTKVAIGYNRPSRDFEVHGLSFMEKGLLLGTMDGLGNPSEQDAYLDIRPDSQDGLGAQFRVTVPTANSKAYSAVANDYTNGVAFSALDYSAANGQGRQTFKAHGNGLLESNKWNTEDTVVYSGQFKDHRGVELYGDGRINLVLRDVPEEGPIKGRNLINAELQDGTGVFRVKEDGRTFANEVVITMPVNFPDYVFEKDYKPMPLDKVELFVKENKHLPGMPTAQEVDELGLNITEVQLKTVEKLEELYLHVIEMNRELTELRHENEILRKELKSK